ncbi:hypothetical protein WDU94_011929 [Cyamophila willieti]
MGTLFYSKTLKNLTKAWPGKKYFGIYRFLPIFFGIGATLEYVMIKWDFNEQVNFYRTYKRRQASIIAEERLHKLLDPSSVTISSSVTRT